jgi:GNAT superfamily N-acetyltransferase
VEVPAVFIRFGDLPEGNSRNWNTGTEEKGVSVYPGWKDPVTKKYVLFPEGQSETEFGEAVATQDALIFSDLPIYEVEGEIMPVDGSDGEPLLKAGTVRIVSSIKRDDLSLSWNLPEEEAVSGKRFAEGEGPCFARDPHPVPATLPVLEIRESEGGWQVLRDGSPLDDRICPTKKVAASLARREGEYIMFQARRKGEDSFSIREVVDDMGGIRQDYCERARQIAKDRSLGITSDRDVQCVAVAPWGSVVGAGFVSGWGDSHTFDVVVAENWEGKGVGSALLDAVIESPCLESAYADVVNPAMRKMLEKRGWEVEQKVGTERWIMAPQEQIRKTYRCDGEDVFLYDPETASWRSQTRDIAPIHNHYMERGEGVVEFTSKGECDPQEALRQYGELVESLAELESVVEDACEEMLEDLEGKSLAEQVEAVASARQQQGASRAI